MTAYPTRAQLYQFGINSAALSNVPTADQDAALESTSRLADTYCRPRHETPFASPYPLEIVRAVCAIAAWDLLSVRGYNPDLGDTLSARKSGRFNGYETSGLGVRISTHRRTQLRQCKSAPRSSVVMTLWTGSREP